MDDQMKLALRGALLSAAADGVTDGAVECVDAVVDTLRAENERLRDLLRACLRGMRRYYWDVLEEAVSMPCGERTLREQIAREVDDG